MVQPERSLTMTNYEETTDKLEQIIDRIGIEKTLEILSEIASAKAEHVATTWQDWKLSHAWERASRALAKYSTSRAVSSL